MTLLSLVGLVSLILFGYGFYLYFIKQKELLEGIIFSFALGTGIVCFIIFMLNGVLGLPINYASSIILCFFLFISGCTMIFFGIEKNNVGVREKRKPEKKVNENNKASGIKNLLRWLIIFIFILILYKSLFFPIVNGDSIGFQAPLVEEIYYNQGLPLDVGPTTPEFTRAYPLFFHIFAAWLINLNQGFNDIFMRMLPPLFSILSVLVTYLLAKKIVFKREEPALLSVFLLLSLPMFVNFSVYLNQETMFTFFSLSGVYFIMKHLQNRSNEDNKKENQNNNELINLIFGFIFFAFSIHTKQLGIFYSLSVFVALTIIIFGKGIKEAYKEKRLIKELKKIIRSKEFKNLCISLIIFVVMIAPYFLRNLVLFNDPLYPFLSASSFGSKVGLKGKNFVPFLFEPVAQVYEKTKFLHYPLYTLFGVFNYVREKSYCMSVFVAVLLLIALLRFRKLNQEQKYLLYFIIIFTAYYVYFFLQKYRYYMAAAPIICIVAAGELERISRKGVDKKTKKILLACLIGLILALIGYLTILAKKDFVIRILGQNGYLAEHFLAMPDLVVIMNLVIPILAVVLLLMTRINKRKALTAIIILILIIPSVYSLIFLNYGITSDTFREGFGWIIKNKDLELFRKEVLKPIPNKEAVLKLNLEEYYYVIKFVNKLPQESVILAAGMMGGYYIDRQIIYIDSYKMAGTYGNISMNEALEILKNNNISYIVYKKPGWDESVFGFGSTISESVILKNIKNDVFFKKVFENSDYVVYEINY